MATMNAAAPKQPNDQESDEYQALRQMIPLDNMNRRSLRYIADNTRLFTLNKDDVLFEIGDIKPFSYYLVKGVICLKDANDKQVMVESGAERGRYAIANLIPRHFRAWVASRKAIIARIDRNLLEKEIAWGQLPSQDKKTGASEDQEWKLNLLRTPVFSKLPMAHVQKLFENLEEFPCAAGETIITEGEPGDYFYLIRSGVCKVMRNAGDRQIELGKLGVSDAFGDEALVSAKPRNASVVMETPGVLMRLSKKDFEQLMHEPLVKKVKLNAAKTAMDKGKALLIDVRMEEEFAENRISDALNIPLFLLHLKAQTLSKHLKYILYCDTGRRSEAAAFVLTRYGFEVYILEDAAAILSGSEYA